MKRRALVVAATVATLAVLSASCSGTGNAGRGSCDRLPTRSDALPSCTYDDLVSLIHGLRGTPIVVNVWGSWCGPCLAEAPILARVSKRFAGRVRFIGVDIEDSRAGAAAWIHRFDWTYPSLFDPSAHGDIRTRLRFLGQPDTVFYDANGNRLTALDQSGPTDEATLVREVSRLLR